MRVKKTIDRIGIRRAAAIFRSTDDVTAAACRRRSPAMDLLRAQRLPRVHLLRVLRALQAQPERLRLRPELRVRP